MDELFSSRSTSEKLSKTTSDLANKHSKSNDKAFNSKTSRLPENLSKITSKADFLRRLNLNNNSYNKSFIEDLVDFASLDDYTELLATRASFGRDIIRSSIEKSAKKGSAFTSMDQIRTQALENGLKQVYCSTFGAPFTYLEAVDPCGRVYKSMYGIRRDQLWSNKISNVSFQDTKAALPLRIDNNDSKLFVAYIKVGMVQSSTGIDAAFKHAESVANKAQNSATNSNDGLFDAATATSLLSSFKLTYKVNNQTVNGSDKDNAANLWNNGSYVPFNDFIYRALTRSIYDHSSELIRNGGNSSDVDIITKIKENENLSYLGLRLEEMLGPNSVPFFKFICSEESIVNETFQNRIGDSMLKSVLEQKISPILREFHFATGGHDPSSFIKAVGNKIGQDAGKITEKAIDMFTNGLGNIVGQDVVDGIMKGNSLVYPQVWQDSSILKIFSLNVRLYSPYGNFTSIFLNVIVPFTILLSLAIPRQTAAAWVSFPFCFSVQVPGFMQSDFCMLTNLGIKRGGRYDAWSDNSIMRGLDLNVDITPLKPTYGLPEEKYTANFTPDTGYKSNDGSDPRNRISEKEIGYLNEIRNATGSVIISNYNPLNNPNSKWKKLMEDGTVVSATVAASKVLDLDLKKQVELAGKNNRNNGQRKS